MTAKVLGPGRMNAVSATWFHISAFSMNKIAGVLIPYGPHFSGVPKVEEVVKSPFCCANTIILTSVP